MRRQTPPTERECRCGRVFTSIGVRATFCSRACQQRFYREDHPEYVARCRAKHFPRKAISYATCGYCDRLFVVRRQEVTGVRAVRCCRQAECRRSYNNERMGGFFREYRERTGEPYTARYREKRSEISRAYRSTEQGREAKRSADHRRRARLLSLPTEVFPAVEIHERDGWRCGICGRRVNRRLVHPHPMSASLDHVVPLSEGGAHTRANTQCSHLACNVTKNNRGGGEQLRLIG
jgi:5-methylcytosine-specific restriction endonuclease McrA